MWQRECGAGVAARERHCRNVNRNLSTGNLLCGIASCARKRPVGGGECVWAAAAPPLGAKFNHTQ